MKSTWWMVLSIVPLVCYDCKVFIKDGRNHSVHAIHVQFTMLFKMYHAVQNLKQMFSVLKGEIRKFEDEDVLLVHERQLVSVELVIWLL